jgi:hypothetical protein
MGNIGIFVRSFLREKAHGAIYDLGETYGDYIGIVFLLQFMTLKKR